MTTPSGEQQPATTGPSAVAAEPPGPQYFSHRQILVILFGVMAGMLLAALDQGIVGTALPRIVSELGGLDRLSWVVTAYLLTSTAVTPLWGKISDLYGRRLIFQVAIGIFLIGSALAGLSQDMTQLIAFRALQGIGGWGLVFLQHPAGRPGRAGDHVDGAEAAPAPPRAPDRLPRRRPDRRRRLVA